MMKRSPRRPQEAYSNQIYDQLEQEEIDRAHELLAPLRVRQQAELARRNVLNNALVSAAWTRMNMMASTRPFDENSEVHVFRRSIHRMQIAQLPDLIQATTLDSVGERRRQRLVMLLAARASASYALFLRRTQFAPTDGFYVAHRDANVYEYLVGLQVPKEGIEQVRQRGRTLLPAHGFTDRNVEFVEHLLREVNVLRVDKGLRAIDEVTLDIGHGESLR